MAQYEVRFETDWDTSTKGRKGTRRFFVEASSPRAAAIGGYDKLMVLSGQGYVKVDDVQGIKGEVRRDRTSPDMWYTGRRHDDTHDPRWSLLVKQGVGIRFNLQFILTKVQ